MSARLPPQPRSRPTRHQSLAHLRMLGNLCARSVDRTFARTQRPPDGIERASCDPLSRIVAPRRAPETKLNIRLIRVVDGQDR